MASNGHQAKVMANREDPIPVVHISSPDDDAGRQATGGESTPAKRSALREQASKIKDMFQSDPNSDKMTLQDRLFAGIMAQIIPTEGMDQAEEEDAAAQGMSKKDRKAKLKKAGTVTVDKPDFGPRLMAINFRRFNARVGALFAAQKGVEELLTWKYPTVTASFLAGHTFLCLNPHLIPVIPLAVAMFLILVPAFLARHPSPDNDPRIEPSYVGPPTAPAVVLKPAPDLSSDFWSNARDLQNTMEDVAHLFDLVNEHVTPVLNFSDEGLTSTVFQSLYVLAGLALVAGQYIPFQTVILVAGWAAFLAGNPRIQKILAASSNPSSMMQNLQTCQTALRNWVDHDILMDAPEVRQVEIFELQRYHDNDDTWEPWLFSPTPYVPLSGARMAGHRPRGTQFFEDVQTPPGWVWKEKKWNLDQSSREWVERRLVTGVEIETEGDRWIYDIPADEVELLGTPSRSKRKNKKSLPKSGWEEGTGQERRGEWRRRRWTRLVTKKPAMVESSQAVPAA